MAKKEIFDVILKMDVVEHVPEPKSYLLTCSSLIKKNGLMICSTINRNYKSYLWAIIGAEYIMKWLPKKTHDWNKFIKPEELEKILHQEKFSTINIKGFQFNPFISKWKESNNLSVNYIVCSLKN